MNSGPPTHGLPRLHLVTDDRVLALGGAVGRIRAAIGAGGQAVAFHLRGPRTSGRLLWEVGRMACEAAADAGALFLVNDRIDLGLALGASGVHLGRRSFTVAQARDLVGGRAVVGCSVHGAAEAREVAAEADGTRGCDFLLAGTLYGTPSHRSAPAAGPSLLGEVAAAIPGVPVVGIGGVTGERAREVLGAGGYGVAVVRAVWDAPDPAAAVRSLLQRLEPDAMGERGREG